MSLQGDNSVIARELQRELKVCAHGEYQPSRLQPITQPSATIVNDGDVSEFEIPAKYINHNLDRLEFDLVAPLITTGSGQFFWVDGIAPVRRMELVSRGGQYVMDLVNPNVFCNMTGRYTHSISEVQSKGVLVASALAGKLTNANGYLENLMPASSATLANKRLQWAGGASQVLANSESFTEPDYYFATGDALARVVTIRFRFPMSALKDTFFDTSQDVNFNEIMLLRITWGNANRIGVTSTAPASIVTTPAAITSYAIINLYYYVALQKKQSVIDMLNSLPEQQIMVKFPILTKIPTTGGAGATNTLSIRYNPPQGRRLLRVYWSPYNTAESGITSYDHDNGVIDGTTAVPSSHKVVSFYTQVDGTRVNQYDYVCVNGDDYHAIKHLLKNSCITSADNYSQNMTFIDNFADNYPMSQAFDYDKQNWVEGKPIEKEIKYEIVFVGTAINLQNYVYAITQKMLMVSKDKGIVVS